MFHNNILVVMIAGLLMKLTNEEANYLIDNIVYELPPCSAIIPSEPVDSLIMEDEHLDTISATKSDEFIKPSVENLVPIPSESEDESECDVPDCDDSQTANFSTFSNPLLDNSTSSDDDEFNPIHNEDLESTLKNDRFATEPYLIESLPNRDTLISSPLKNDSIHAEFTGALIFLKSIPPGINEADYDPEEDIHLVKRLLYDNSYPRPPEEIDLSFNSDDPLSPGIEEDDDDSKRDIPILEELLDQNDG
nr:hypothetical protein [Tanacetum cinerariifolium]